MAVSGYSIAVATSMRSTVVERELTTKAVLPAFAMQMEMGSCMTARVETTPVLWKGKLLRFESVRGNYGEEPKCPTCGLGKRTHSL